MTDQEKRELDAWICERVFKLKRVKHPWEVKDGTFAVSNNGVIYVLESFNHLKLFHPTTDRAPAMEVLEVCLEKLAGVTDVLISKTNNWHIECDFDEHPGIGVSAENLPLAICKFARALYEQKGVK